MITLDNIGHSAPTAPYKAHGAKARWAKCIRQMDLFVRDPDVSGRMRLPTERSDAASSSAKLEGMTLQLISSQPRSELTREVSRALSATGLTLLEGGDAMLRLRLQPEQFTQRNISLTAQARAAELELTLFADFTLMQAEMDPIDARATVTRQMLNDPRNVVGKTEEIRLLRDEMRRDLADQVARRVSYSLSS